MKKFLPKKQAEGSIEKLRQLGLFKYEALRPDEIRLLQLRPASNDSPFHIGRLIKVRLHPNDSQEVLYDALSYTWGSGPADRPMSLWDKCFWIKPNLDAVLQRLRHPRQDRFLWIDAICVNQGDIAERNEQVRLMKLIYQQARRVLVWIGPSHPSGGDRNLMKFLSGFAASQRLDRDPQWLFRRLARPELVAPQPSWGLGQDNWGFGHPNKITAADYHPEEHADCMLGLPSSSDGAWPSLVDFFDAPWWRRVWVRQEIAMSSHAVMLYGDQSADWTDVTAVCHWLVVWATDLDTKTREHGASHRSGAYSGEDLEYFRQTLKAKVDLDFEAMLIHARDCEATDPRDKVFAILGMVDNAE